MILVLAVFLGGVLTIVSPCILPVLPFVFARSEGKFLTNGLPLLGGMALTFAAIASLAAVGGAWAVRVNQYGRIAALLMLTLFAATLLSRTLADRFARPFVALGNRLIPAADTDKKLLPSVLLGVATGLLWAPCAGPILGLVLTGAAISGPNGHTTLLLFAYAAGAATSLAIALLAGGTVFSALKRSLGAGEWVRRALGIAVLLGVIAIAFGLDSSLLTRLSLAGTNNLEQRLLSKLNPGTSAPGASAGVASGGVGGLTAPKVPAPGAPLPRIDGATAWLNSKPLTLEALHGKVVLVDFWTYSCINCLRSLPYVKAWYDKYKDHGLVIVGVHSPEFAFEKNAANVGRAVVDLGVRYPVALDTDFAIWRSFGNHYWPAHFYVDAQGNIRGHHYGEGEYPESEQALRTLLIEAGNTDLPPAGMDASTVAGIQAAADTAHDQSPETYIGYRRAAKFGSPGGLVKDTAHDYELPIDLQRNQWALAGQWTVDPEKAVLNAAPGEVVYKFYARDLHLVLGPGSGKPVRFRVQLDGADPGANHGVDTDADGRGVIDGQRLYQLIRQSGSIGEHLFSIEFLDDGVQAYSFTFG